MLNLRRFELVFGFENQLGLPIVLASDAMDLTVTYKTIPVTPVLASYLVDNFTQHLLYMRGQMPLYVHAAHRLRL